ncbi:MAG: Lrp/AsnC family transcriptional regulator [Methanosarcinaceae archaeon]|nr:Lrp/AsnC family transcriptional regulator [Methanosarcinaceae archaeon]NKQ39743.1 Lrp/AsnC family transcriptional regulator [Methanosarcinales archaeon]
MDDTIRNILEIIENDAKATPLEISRLTGVSVKDIEKTIKELEDKNIIRKYKTIIDWEKAGDVCVHAVIELKVTLERKLGYKAIAERIYKFPEVLSVRLLSGNQDLSITIRAKSMKELAFFVAEKIATLNQVNSTTTYFVLKTYKEDGVILEEKESEKKRLPITP